ncbi:MAG: hypothetical protein GY913_03100 [Proteobacteria bacterium]|nr:hypothetical protein [Pseudomonadota bacterium]MCP4915887.1 hypothetical protein [Pseudomonadota bacterium]
MTFLLLLCSMALAVPGDELRRGIDRHVVLIDADGRQIDCALVEVEAERLIVRFEDGTLAQVPRNQVVNLVDLGPAPPPPPVEAEPEPEDDFGEDALDDSAEDGFDVDSALDELLIGEDLPGDEHPSAEGEGGSSDAEDAPSAPALEEAVAVDSSQPEAVVARVELPLDELDDLPEPTAVAAADEDPFDEPAETADEPAVEETDEPGEPAVADLGVTAPDESPPELAPDTQAETELYYTGRADGALAAKDADFRAAAGLGYGLGCTTACVGCAGVTLGYAVMEPTVPGGVWQETEDVYQQGYIQAYRDSYQREAAKRAFIGGTLGTVTFAIVATVTVSQLL